MAPQKSEDFRIRVLAILAVLLILLLSVGGFYLSWRMHTFRITNEQVEVRSGILFRTFSTAMAISRRNGQVSGARAAS